MMRPRIIIADTDEIYVQSLQFKFIEEFFEKIDLEIITEEKYFDELFMNPQKAEILIISEELYSIAIQKHNISHIFLMTENTETEATGDLNVERIYKYTGIREIFNEILGKSGKSLTGEMNIRQEPKIILVYSAKGGVGKTTLSLGICGALANNFKRVLYMNADHLQSFQKMMENTSPITSNDIYVKLSSAKDVVYDDIKHIIRQENFSYLPPFKAALMSLGLKYCVFEKIALSAKKSTEYDFIIIDSNSVFDEDKARLMDIADKVIVVTDQTEASVYATNVLVGNINGVSEGKYIFICNNFDRENDNALIKPGLSMKFKIDEYIEHFAHYDRVKSRDLKSDIRIQKTAFWVM